MNDNQLTVDLPLNSRYVKFLFVRFGLGDKIILSRKDPEGLFLHTLLKMPHPGNPFFKVKRKNTVSIILSDPDHNKKMFVTKRRLTDYQTWLDGYLRNEFIQFVTNYNKLGGYTVDDSIRGFKEKYYFTDEDWSFDAMKKYYYRTTENRKYKKRREKTAA